MTAATICEPVTLADIDEALGYAAGSHHREIAAVRGVDLEEWESGPKLRVVGKGGVVGTVPAHPEVVAVSRAARYGRAALAASDAEVGLDVVGGRGAAGRGAGDDPPGEAPLRDAAVPDDGGPAGHVAADAAFADRDDGRISRGG